MKIKQLVFVAVLLLLTGCSSKTDDLERDVKTLENKITQLEKEKEKTTKNNKEDTSTASKTNIESKINEFKTNGDNLIKRINAISYEDDKVKNIKAYTTLDTESDTIELAMETYENTLDRTYKDNKLTFNEVRDYKKQLDKIEDEIDSALDALELRLKL
ncbi:MAG: hypothetical protein RR986_05410, partial [Longicatena sp.]